MRVYARIKPSISELDADENIIRFDAALPTTLQLVKPTNPRDEPIKFHLDGIFSPTAQQADIFKDVTPFLTSFLNGVNVCIFAYGQTGSGKTYTMEGPDLNSL